MTSNRGAQDKRTERIGRREACTYSSSFTRATGIGTARNTIPRRLFDVCWNSIPDPEAPICPVLDGELARLRSLRGERRPAEGLHVRPRGVRLLARRVRPPATARSAEAAPAPAPAGPKPRAFSADLVPSTRLGGARHQMIKRRPLDRWGTCSLEHAPVPADD